MKLKGIKPVEQHFEKVLVVVLAGIFMLVLLMQFAVQPNMVGVGNPKKDVRPGSAYGPIAKRAAMLSADMTRPDPALPEVQTVDIASDFRTSLTGGVSPRAMLALGIPGRQIEGGENVEFDRVGQRRGTKYAPFVPPAPDRLVIGSVTNTLSPLDVQAIKGLADYLPARQPYDKNIITVEAIFDGKAAGELLRNDPDGAGEIMRFNRNWWRNKIQILSIRLEREELAEDGQWTNLSVVPALPGTVSLIDDIETNVRSTRELESLAESAARGRQQGLIRQPPYYQTIAGREWKPPIDLAEDDANNVDQFRIDEFLSRLARAEKKLEELKVLQEERQAATGVKMPRFDRRIKEREEEIEDLKDELRSMGQVFDDDAEDRNQNQADDLEKEMLVLQDDAIRIWAHDITAEPGTTYRYRIGVVMNNPAFGRHAVMHEDQKSLADEPLVLGEMSPWTDPFEVDQMQYFFVTSATGAGRDVPGGLGGRGLASGAKASVDVFRFHYGFWRRGTAGLKPGDVIIADVSNPQNLYTFDFDAAPKDPATGLVSPAALEPPELDEDGNPIDPPEWFVPVLTRMSAAVNAQFLDVSRIPGDSGGGIGGTSSQRKYQAVLKGGSSAKLFVRNPSAEKASERYRRLVRSAKLGETQGQPVVKEQKPQPRAGEDPTPSGGDPIPSGGGGGG